MISIWQKTVVLKLINNVRKSVKVFQLNFDSLATNKVIYPSTLNILIQKQDVNILLLITW